MSILVYNYRENIFSSLDFNGCDAKDKFVLVLHETVTKSTLALNITDFK